MNNCPFLEHSSYKQSFTLLISDHVYEMHVAILFSSKRNIPKHISINTWPEEDLSAFLSLCESHKDSINYV